MDSIPFQENLARESELRRRALIVLRLDEGASAEEVRRAWRRECLRTHPDRNPEDRDAQKKFNKVNCAYHLLLDGTPCDELLDEPARAVGSPRDGGYMLTNQWGVFLWWRERFF